MSLSRTFPALFACAALFAIAPLHAQNTRVLTTPDADSSEATTDDSGPSGIIPYQRGYNLSLGTTSQHDSSNGWTSLLTPDAAFRFNRHFAADFGIPVYVYINVLTNTGTAVRPVETYVTRNHALGDANLNGHYETSFTHFDYNATATLGFATGNPAYGLGAGKTTYFVNNHFEKDFGIFAPDIELGIGDTSSLQDSRVRRSYTTVGELAHFQAGTSIDLPRNLAFSADAYEELPLTSQTIFSTTGKGRKKVTTATNEGAAEDNGFLTTLDIPLSGHVTLSGFYNRSLRSHIDTAGFSFTFLLKAPPRDVPR